MAVVGEVEEMFIAVVDSLDGRPTYTDGHTLAVQALEALGELRLRFRAEPDCCEPTHSFETDTWTSYALEIYWTHSTGYDRRYQNGVLIDEMASRG